MLRFVETPYSPFLTQRDLLRGHVPDTLLRDMTRSGFHEQYWSIMAGIASIAVPIARPYEHSSDVVGFNRSTLKPTLQKLPPYKTFWENQISTHNRINPQKPLSEEDAEAIIRHTVDNIPKAQELDKITAEIQSYGLSPADPQDLVPKVIPLIADIKVIMYGKGSEEALLQKFGLSSAK